MRTNISITTPQKHVEAHVSIGKRCNKIESLAAVEKAAAVMIVKKVETAMLKVTHATSIMLS